MTGARTATIDVRAQAVEAALRAADEAGVAVELVETPEQARSASELFAAVWSKPNGEPAVLPEFARALAHAGNPVALAVRRGDVVGASLAFRGADAAGPLLHSHLVGVRPGLEGRHVGFALKQQQRAWSLGEGLERITWTFDPLVARNAYFNVAKLGAELTAFHVDFYGQLDDGLNDGSPSDRCLVTWSLTSPRVASAAIGSRISPDVDVARTAVVLEPGPDGAPILTPGHEDAFSCRVPSDIVGLRQRDRRRADEWRAALRGVFVDAFGSGLRVADVTHDGCYLFHRP